jgi:hypothetical protein
LLGGDWFVKLRTVDAADFDALLAGDAYKALIG